MIADLTPKESYDYSTSSMIFLTDPEGVECLPTGEEAITLSRLIRQGIQ